MDDPLTREPANFRALLLKGDDVAASGGRKEAMLVALTMLPCPGA
jgi:hypothetical protein